MTHLHSRWVRFIAVLATLSTAAIAHAHPGHGTTNPDSPAHLLEPVHFVTLFVGLCAIAGLTGAFVIHQRLKPARSHKAASDRSPTGRDD